VDRLWIACSCGPLVRVDRLCVCVPHPHHNVVAGDWLRARWLFGGLAGWLAGLSWAGLGGWHPATLGNSAGLAGSLARALAVGSAAWLAGSLVLAAWLAGSRAGCRAAGELAGLSAFGLVCCVPG